MEVIDSSVLVAAFNADDALHERGVSALREAEKPIGIPEYVASETATVLANKVSKKVADTFVRSLFNTGDIVLIPSSPEQFTAAAKYFLTTKKLSFVDAALLALSKSYTVITFDTALSRAIGKNKNSSV